MASYNPIVTPIDTRANFGRLFIDSLSVAWLVCFNTLSTRLNIKYVGQKVCLFMYLPDEPHFQFLTHNFLYVKGTLNYILHLTLAPPRSIMLKVTLRSVPKLSMIHIKILYFNRMQY